MHAWLQQTLQIIFPSTCLLCRIDLHWSYKKPVCIRCLSDVSAPLSVPCPALLSDLNGYFPAGAFEGPIRELMHRYKYEDKDYLSSILVDFWIEHWEAVLNDVDMIVPVPLSLSRKWSRGFDQAGQLATELAQRGGLPLRRDLLRRSFFSSSQTKLNKKDRLKNALASFKSNPTLNSSLKGKHVLLFDDVCTTGATLHCCAELLMEMGADEISVAMIAQEAL